MSALEANENALEANEPIPARRRSLMQRARWPAMIAVVVLAAVIGLFVYLTGGRYETTDDAQVGGARVSIAPSLSGRVMEIDVHEGQDVKAGQILFRLDERPLQTALEQAQANVATSRLQVAQMKATYAQRQADVRTAQASLSYAQTAARRAANLVTAGTATQAQLDEAQSAVDQAQQKLAAAREAANAALAALGGNANVAADDHPLVKQAQAQATVAALNRSYVDIIAPQDGIVTRVEQLQVGDYINTGTPVFSLVSDRLWVDANFKENQLEYMRPGQTATIKLDAYPDLRFQAKIASITPGTGSSFSLLPPENATGNWVKVTQRVPVRLTFVKYPEVPLQPGLSATVKVDTRHHRHLFGKD
jgi:membrane fusion protein (multidrug efflux system)